jgi:hypothetical protein
MNKSCYFTNGGGIDMKNIDFSEKSCCGLVGWESFSLDSETAFTG